MKISAADFLGPELSRAKIAQHQGSDCCALGALEPIQQDTAIQPIKLLNLAENRVAWLG